MIKNLIKKLMSNEETNEETNELTNDDVPAEASNEGQMPGVEVPAGAQVPGTDLTQGSEAQADVPVEETQAPEAPQEAEGQPTAESAIPVDPS